MRRVALILLAGAGLMAAAPRLDLFQVFGEQRRRNYAEWLEMSPEDRAGVREVWRTVSDTPSEERRGVMRRMATLSRLQAQLHKNQERPATRDDLEKTLSEMPRRVRAHLGLDPDDRVEVVAERIRERTKDRIDAFFANLVGDRLTAEDLDEVRELPWDDYIARALEEQKREQIFLYAEGSEPSAPEAQAEVVELQDMDALDVAERVREHRRMRGLMGRASLMLDLTEEERQELWGHPEEGLVRRLKQLMEPKVRGLLEERGFDAQRIDHILRKPYRDLERHLNRLLRESP